MNTNDKLRELIRSPLSDGNLSTAGVTPATPISSKTNALVSASDQSPAAPKPGYVQWHCSDEGGGPDVGILLGLTADSQLWFGEMLTADSDKPGWGFVLYGPGSARMAFVQDDEIRELIEDHIAPAIRQASITQQTEEVARLRGAVQRLDLDSVHTCHDQCQRLPCVQQREIARLREALKPFADKASLFSGADKHGFITMPASAFRAARAALNEQPGEEGAE